MVFLHFLMQRAITLIEWVKYNILCYEYRKMVKTNIGENRENKYIYMYIMHYFREKRERK